MIGGRLMIGRVSRLCLLGLAAAVMPAAAQEVPLPPFEELVFLSCSEAQTMDPGERVAIARFLANRAAAHYGIALPDEEAAGRELGILVRGACTMFPQALLFGVIAQAVRVEAERLAAKQ
jgi:hypothetical protein